MKITNTFNLPQPFVDLVSESNYSAGESDITTTGLFQPPKVRELMRRYGDTVTEDASDRVWTLLGTANHWVLEQIAKRNPARYVTEERFYMDVDGVKLGGQIDLYDKQEQVLYDYKVSSVYKAMSDDRSDWTSQANVNKMLCEKNGYPVKRMSVILIMKDWKLRDARNKADYPKCAVLEIHLKSWHADETLAYIKSRINLHSSAKALNSDDDIPVCTESERWRSQDLYAVLKDKTAKRAVPNGTYQSRPEAEAHARKIGGIVEERLGEDKRCRDYCKVRAYCNYGRTLKTEE